MSVSATAKHTGFFLLIIFLLIIFSQLGVAIAKVRVDFYYSSGCGECMEKMPIINETEQEYGNRIQVYKKDISRNEHYLEEWKDYGFFDVPAVVIENETKIPKYELTKEHLEGIIDSYLSGNKTNASNIQYVEIPFIGNLNLSELSQWSLPLLAVVLGAIDSINPCSFFILLFLLNLLIYTNSRKKMILVGGIFIFFSGFIYFIFMSAMLSVFILTSHVEIITLVAGAIALFLASLNIKDFFFFKRGLSASIPESKKSSLFKQMRDLIRATKASTVILGTIILAISANTYELFCTLGFPMIFTKILTLHDISIAEYYLYLILYNVVYVLPLCVIVSIFVITFGRKKLSQWQGRILKLLSGVMMFLLGLILIFYPELLDNIFTAIGIILLSILLTSIVSTIWKTVLKKV